MNIAVVFRSMTGHSKKLAKAIAASIGVEALNIKSKPVLENVDLLFFAGGIYGRKSLEDTVAYAKSLNPSSVKKAVLITSSTSDKCGQDEVRSILSENGIEVVDEYRCLGNFLFMKMGHPNKAEILGAAEFAKSIVEANLQQQ